jgi:CheY-like chemotaxis protein
MNPNVQATIMVVDDDPGHRTTLQTIIKSWGYAVEVTDEGQRKAVRCNLDGCPHDGDVRY